MISRTISYAVVVALLSGAFFGVVVVVGSLLRSSDPIVVPAATLAVAAMFNPIRRRVQRRVDLFFNRSGYQAEAVSEAFAAELKELLSPQDIMFLWSRTVEKALQPHTIGSWLRDRT